MIDVTTPLWEAAKAVYEAAKEVKENYEECAAIQKAVSALVKTLKTRTTVTDTLLEHIKTMTATLQDLTKTLRTLAAHSLFYRILHRKSIKCRLQDTRKELETATTLFQVGAQAELLIAMNEVQINVQKIADAQRRDELATEARYVELLRRSESDMIQTLGVDEKKMPDAMLALSKHMEDMPEGLEKRCCERGIDAMRRLTGEVITDMNEFTLSSYEVAIHKNEKLGAGGFAQVYRGIYRDGLAVAVKVLAEGAPVSALRQEVDVWKSLSHDNILQFIGVCSTVDPPFMVCAYKKNGNALDYLRKNPTASRHKLLYEASQGLVYLHDKNVVHGDIKATNILIDANGTACLADFGLSRVKLQTTMALNLDSKPQRGTVRWMAPEQLGGSSASWKTDIYSFAMTIYETFTGRPPFSEHDDAHVFRMVHDNAIRPPFSDVKEEVRALGLNTTMWTVIENCWKQDPKERWSALELSESLHKLRNAKPANSQVSAPALGSQGRSVSDYASHPPPGPGSFLQVQDHPRPRPVIHPYSAPTVPRLKELPSVSPPVTLHPNIPTSPPNPAGDETTQTYFSSAKAALGDESTSDKTPSAPSTATLVQPVPLKVIVAGEGIEKPTSAHSYRHPAHANTTPAEYRDNPELESFTRAATLASSSATILRPLSPNSWSTFLPQGHLSPKLVSPLHIEPLRGHGEMQRHSLQSDFMSTSNAWEDLLIFKDPAPMIEPTIHTSTDSVSFSQSRDNVSSTSERLASPRVRQPPKTEPIPTRSLPLLGTSPTTMPLSQTPAAPANFDPFDEDVPSPSSDEQTPSTPSRSPFYSVTHLGSPEPQPSANPSVALSAHLKSPDERPRPGAASSRWRPFSANTPSDPDNNAQGYDEHAAGHEDLVAFLPVSQSSPFLATRFYESRDPDETTGLA